MLRLLATGLIVTGLAAGCGDAESRDAEDGSVSPSVLRIAADATLDVGGEPVYAHWSEAGNETGERVVITSVLLELTADASADSFVGKLLGEPVPAGVHVLRVREFTAEEMAAHDACVASAAEPDRECPTLRYHVSVDPTSTVDLVAGDHRPDLG